MRSANHFTHIFGVGVVLVAMLTQGREPISHSMQ